MSANVLPDGQATRARDSNTWIVGGMPTDPAGPSHLSGQPQRVWRSPSVPASRRLPGSPERTIRMADNPGLFARRKAGRSHFKHGRTLKQRHSEHGLRD